MKDVFFAVSVSHFFRLRVVRDGHETSLTIRGRNRAGEFNFCLDRVVQALGRDPHRLRVSALFLMGFIPGDGPGQAVFEGGKRRRSQFFESDSVPVSPSPIISDVPFSVSPQLTVGQFKGPIHRGRESML